ncbi:MAG TPA: nicotinate (nicotinamide) nucleotide adenylyltransferase [Macromonas sp.]|nr:nicotinate (nicotinamide) nucleotide adenylyltransferase [Macromonas sp.]
MSSSASRHPLRVGMFGGAFDPPHLAHRELAAAALEQLELDVLHILPTGQAWHKTRQLTAARDRLAMCEQAFASLPRVRLDDREIRRAGPSYTADTLAELAAEYPQAQLFLVMGADQLLAFKSWVRWQEVAERATLAVANRPMSPSPGEPDTAESDLAQLGVPFEPLSMPLRPISATAVRAHLAKPGGQAAEWDVLVPEGVARYISDHHLYETPT